MKPVTLDQARLRRRAEAQMAKGDLPTKLNLDPIRLLHELQVHKIELELQNEELLSANRELESLRVRYQSLYELAPVGYLTLSMAGDIVDLNERAVEMLHAPRGAVLNKPMRGHFEAASLPAFDALFRSVVEAGADGSAEDLLVQRPQALSIYVRVQARCVKYSEFEPPIVLLIMMDVSALKYAMDDVLSTIEKRTPPSS